MHLSRPHRARLGSGGGTRGAGRSPVRSYFIKVTALAVDGAEIQEAIARYGFDDIGFGLGLEGIANASAREVLAVANSTDANGNEHSADDGRFVPKGGAGSPRESETRPQHDRYGLNDAARLAAEPKRNAERAKAALDEVLRKRGGYVDKAAYRPECGWIRLDWGDAGNPGEDYKGGHGISHILAKHPDDLKHLPAVIASGEAFRHPTDETKMYFVHGDRFAVVASLHKGAKKTITSYEPDRAGDIAKIRKYPRAQAPGK